MTDMKHTSVSLPDDLVSAIQTLQESGKFRGCSYSEIVRRLVRIALSVDADDRAS